LLLLENIKALTINTPHGTTTEGSFIAGGIITKTRYPDGTIQDTTITRGEVVYTKFNRPIVIGSDGAVTFVTDSTPGAIPANTEIKISKTGIEILQRT
jgi:hypothetical protein